MGPTEGKHKLFRRFFSRKPKTRHEIENEPEKDDTEAEDKLEREKVQKLQSTIKAQARAMFAQLETLEKASGNRYEHIIGHSVFGIVFTLTLFSLINLLHAASLFDSYPSDPLDVFRGVSCGNDLDSCTIRYYFDLEPPSFVCLAIGTVIGCSGLALCVRNLVSVDTGKVVFHLFSASLFSISWIIKRELYYKEYTIPL